MVNHDEGCPDTDLDADCLRQLVADINHKRWTLFTFRVNENLIDPTYKRLYRETPLTHEQVIAWVCVGITVTRAYRKLLRLSMRAEALAHPTYSGSPQETREEYDSIVAALNHSPLKQLVETILDNEPYSTILTAQESNHE